MYLIVLTPLINFILEKDDESTSDTSGSRPLRALLGVAPLIGPAPVLIKTPLSG